MPIPTSRPRSWYVWLTLLAAGLAAAPAAHSSQQQGPPQQPIFRAGVDLLRVDGGEVLDGAVDPLEDARKRAAEQLAAFPDRHQRLDDPDPYPVEMSERLMELRSRAMEGMGRL